MWGMCSQGSQIERGIPERLPKANGPPAAPKWCAILRRPGQLSDGTLAARWISKEVCGGLARRAFSLVGLHRSPLPFVVISPLGRSPLLAFGPSYSASSRTSPGTSSSVWPLRQEPLEGRPRSCPGRRQARTASCSDSPHASSRVPFCPLRHLREGISRSSFLTRPCPHAALSRPRLPPRAHAIPPSTRNQGQNQSESRGRMGRGP